MGDLTELAGKRILEPSAAARAFLIALLENKPAAHIDNCEIMADGRAVMARIPNTRLVADDSLTLSLLPVNDLIIANPPFSNNKAISLVMDGEIKIHGTGTFLIRAELVEA